MEFSIDHHGRIKTKKLFVRLLFFLSISLVCYTTISYFYKQRQIERSLASTDPFGDGEERCSLDDQAPQGPWPLLTNKRFAVQSGETLAHVLFKAGVSADQVQEVISSLKSHFNPTSLQVGCTVYLRCMTTDEEDSKGCDLQRLSLFKDTFTRVVAERDEESELPRFMTYTQDRQLIKQKVFVRGTINSGLYADATKQGVPSATLSEIMKVFSYDVDFQRDMHKGDQFEFLFITYNDQNGKVVAPGAMIYGKLNLSGSLSQVYRYPVKDGEYSYFNELGQSIIKGLLRTPIDGSRISSGYGMRRHPVLGYTRQHKGIDFAAHTGSPIMAAGDGVVVKAVRYHHSWGNYVKIKHKNNYSTLYAHMSRIHPKLLSRIGIRVRQGQVIGYVGSTGLASGPHLHYEMYVGSKHVNPQSVKQLPASSLGGRDLHSFLAFRTSIEQVLDKTPREQLANRLNNLDILNVF